MLLRSLEARHARHLTQLHVSPQQDTEKMVAVKKLVGRVAYNKSSPCFSQTVTSIRFGNVDDTDSFKDKNHNKIYLPPAL